MNCVDYLFENTSTLRKDLILGSRETISYQLIIENSFKLSIYLQEKIDRLPGVIDNTIEAIEDELLGEAIKATVIVNAIEVDLSEEKIRRYCSLNLSNYKIPTVIDIRKEMIISATGKKIKNHFF